MSKINYLNAKDLLHGIGGISLDCDGVILDSKKSNVAYYNLIRANLDLEPMDSEQEKFVHSRTVWESIEHIVPKEKMEQARIVVRNIDYVQLLALTEKMPNLDDFLLAVKNRSICLGINTNRMNTMDYLLEKFSLAGIFSFVVTASKVKKPKPHPEGLLLTAKFWKIKPSELVFIGDSDVDALAAKNAGTRFWSFANESLECDFLIKDWASLTKILTTNF